MTVSWNRVEAPWGEGSTNLVSSRLTYTLTPRMFVAALLQFQSRTDSIASNARFRWEYQPGSELFIVYSDGRTTLGRGFPSVENRSFVVKITRLFRVVVDGMKEVDTIIWGETARPPCERASPGTRVCPPRP